MKKPKTVARKVAVPTDSVELRRWCIESAIRWPVDGGYGPGSYQQHMPRGDVDVIARAKRLLEWVTAS